MDQSTDIISLQRRTVQGFRAMDDGALLSLASTPELPVSCADLILCRDHYRRVEQRDPTFGELLFLGALFERCRALSHHTYIAAVTSEQDDDLRSFADLQRKTAPATAPLSIPQMMQTVGNTLRQVGITPWHEALHCCSILELAAQNGDAGSALSLNGIAATLQKHGTVAAKTAQTLVLLRGTAAEATRFFAELKRVQHRFIATVGAEGIFPHLTALTEGVDLDLTPFREYAPQNGFASLPQIGKNGILVALPYQYLAYLFSKGFPLAFCGYLTTNRRLTVRIGPEICLSVATSLLQAVGQRVLTPTLSRSEPRCIASGMTVIDGTQVGGIQMTGGCRLELCRLIASMVAQGADLRRVSATALLELPLENGDAGVAAALPLLLDLHRVAAELALPVAQCRVVSITAGEAPRLTVFLAAEKVSAPREEITAAVSAAAENEDFAALRALLRK